MPTLWHKKGCTGCLWQSQKQPGLPALRRILSQTKPFIISQGCTGICGFWARHNQKESFFGMDISGEKKNISAFQKGKKKTTQQSFPNFWVKSSFFLMTYNICLSLSLQAHIQQQPHQELCCTGVTLALWGHKHKTERGLWIIRASREQTHHWNQTSALNKPKHSFSSVHSYQHKNFSLKWASLQKLLTCLELQKGIRNLAKDINFTGLICAWRASAMFALSIIINAK